MKNKQQAYKERTTASYREASLLNNVLEKLMKITFEIEVC